MSFQPLPKTRRGWAYLAMVAAVFGALNVAALAGSALALGLLVTLSAVLVGVGLSYLVSRPLLKGAGPGGPRRLAGFMVGVACVFGIPFVGAAIFGIPPFPTAEGGNTGHAVHGFSYGFGLGLARFSASSGGVVTRRSSLSGDGRAWMRIGVVVLGAVMSLILVAFVASLVFEYVLGPIVRNLG